MDEFLFNTTTLWPSWIFNEGNRNLNIKKRKIIKNEGYINFFFSDILLKIITGITNNKNIKMYGLLIGKPSIKNKASNMEDLIKIFM